MSKGKTLTSKDFEIIKKLLNAGLTISQVKEVTTWKDTAIRYVQQAENYAEYTYNKQQRLSKNKKAVIEPITTLETLPNSTELHTNDDKVIETLAGLTQAVNRLADVLEQDTPLEKEAKQYRLFSRK